MLEGVVVLEGVVADHRVPRNLMVNAGATVVLDDVSFVEGSSHVAIRPNALTVVIVDVVVAPCEILTSCVATYDLGSACVVVRVVVAGVIPCHLVALDQYIVTRTAFDAVLAIVVNVIVAKSVIGCNVDPILVVTGFVVIEHPVVSHLKSGVWPNTIGGNEVLYDESLD